MGISLPNYLLNSNSILLKTGEEGEEHGAVLFFFNFTYDNIGCFNDILTAELDVSLVLISEIWSPYNKAAC